MVQNNTLHYTFTNGDPMKEYIPLPNKYVFYKDYRIAYFYSLISYSYSGGFPVFLFQSINRIKKQI